jgi:hypothetical protein
MIGTKILVLMPIAKILEQTIGLQLMHLKDYMFSTKLVISQKFRTYMKVAHWALGW